MKPMRQDKKGGACDFWHRAKMGVAVYAVILLGFFVWGLLP